MFRACWNCSCHLFWVVLELMPKWIWLDFTQNNQLQTFLISWSASVQSAHTSIKIQKNTKLIQKTTSTTPNSNFNLNSLVVFNPIGKYALQIESFPISPTRGQRKKNIETKPPPLLHPQEIQGAILQVGWRLVKIKVFRPTKGTSPKTSKSTDRRRLPFLRRKAWWDGFSLLHLGLLSFKVTFPKKKNEKPRKIQPPRL